MDWKLWPEAETYINELVREFILANEYALNFAADLRQKTSTRLINWIDCIELYTERISLDDLQQLGFQREWTPVFSDEIIYSHPGAKFPRLVVNKRRESAANFITVYIKCDSLACLSEKILGRKITSNWHCRYGKLLLNRTLNKELWGVERHAYDGMVPWNMSWNNHQQTRYQVACRGRGRYFSNDQVGMQATLEFVGKLVEEIDVDLAADIFMESERWYWELSNKAAAIQKLRQDEMGLGWANHDHHTFRSSREHFVTLIKILETLGFQCRERFYAGAEAGWGAQVMEQPIARIVVFADVDLAPEEVDIDFAHQPLASRKELGTVGLWCALHGESILQAGMHHLEIQCDFNKFRYDFEEMGIALNPPFANEPFLRQGFTAGQLWKVPEQRLKELLAESVIDQEQYDRFTTKGAIGSHLEHLERHGGYRGFLQEGVNKTMRETDPRNCLTK